MHTLWTVEGTNLLLNPIRNLIIVTSNRRWLNASEGRWNNFCMWMCVILLRKLQTSDMLNRNQLMPTDIFTKAATRLAISDETRTTDEY